MQRKTINLINKHKKEKQINDKDKNKQENYLKMLIKSINEKIK